MNFYKSKLADTERDVFLSVVRDASDLPFSLCDILHNEVAVVAPQVVEDNRYGCRLRAKPQLQVALIVGRTSILASNVAVVSHGIAFGGLAADLAICGFLVALSVLSCHVHRLGVIQQRLHLTAKLSPIMTMFRTRILLPRGT